MRRSVGLVLALALVVTGCKRDDHGHDHGHDHSEEHPAGHDHHAEGHGHGEAVVRITRWSKHYELFAEHPVAEVGKAIELLVHLTVLDGFSALNQGTIRLSLSGPATVKAESAKPVRPGIYRLSVTLPKPGKYSGALAIDGTVKDTIESIEVEAHQSVQADGDDDHDDGLIELLKEQQWGLPFATAFVTKGKLTPAIEVAGKIDTPPGGSAEVGAPVAGRVAASGELPRPGDSVKKGQRLAALVPTPSSPEDAARAKLAVTEAKARAEKAEAALARAERLIKDEAISKRELEDARREASVAKESVTAAQRAAGVFSGAQSGGGGASWRLVAPISGTVVSVSARPGRTVSPGDALFRIVDTKEIWAVARVPEQDAARVHTEADARLRVSGLEKWFELRVSGDDANASVVSVGRVVDPKTRTVDVIYALKDPDPRVRVGALTRLALPAGEPFEGIVIDTSALIEREGRQVVYVQVDGEHFEERTVRLGPRAAERVSVKQGLKVGERIVTRGAQVVRLADTPAGAQPHGHVH